MVLLGTSLFGASTIKIFIDLDQYEGETSWTLKDPNGTTVANGSGYGSSDDIIVVDAAVNTSGTYVFEIDDSYGDGLAGGGSENSQAMYEISLDGKVIFRSGEYPNFGDSATVNIDISDIDGDHVADESDPDTDGDGILDYNEEGVATVAQTGTWDANTVSASSGNTNISMVSVPDSGVSDWTYNTTDTFNSNNGDDLWATAGLTGDDSLTFTFGTNMNVTAGTTRKMTLYFSEPQTDVVIHFDRIGGFANGNPNSAVFTLTNADINLTRLSGNTQFIADSGTKKIYRDTQYDCNDSESNSATNFTAAGSVEFKSTTPFSKLLFDVNFTGVDGGDAVEIIVEADSYAVLDTDSDGISDKLDLDSDNDGISDNVEAQSTGSYAAPTGNDTDGDGIDDAYDPDNGGTAVLLPDTDGDGIRDNLDTDSDNDGITDCEEGIPDGTAGKVCPVVLGGGDTNGLVDWAETGGNDQGYTDANGIADDPSTDLENETGDTTEVAYREILCGKAERKLTPFNWVVVSVPCDTGTASISDLFSGSLGTYGDNNNWVMYKQNTQYTGSNTYDMVQMSASDTLEMGKGYWLIVDGNNTDPDGNKTMKLDTSAAGIQGKTPSVNKTNYGGVGTNDDGFDEVFAMDSSQGNGLPDSQSDRKTKIMLGNPFVRNIHSGRIYYSNDDIGQTYYPFTDSTNLDGYVERILYMHDSPDLKPGAGGNNGEYIAVSPDTPGFGDTIAPMYGYWMLIKQDSGTHVTGNAITMPFEKK